MTITVQKRCHW